MTLGALERVDQSTEVVDGTGLLGGITGYELRVLCDNPWRGGGGYTPNEVGEMTLDQVWFRLCELDNLKKIGHRVKRASSLEALDLIKPSADGMLVARDSQGNAIHGRVRGYSKAKELSEAAKKKALDAKRELAKSRVRGRRKR